MWVSLFSRSSLCFKYSACKTGLKCYFNALHITRLPFFPGHPGLKTQSPLTCLSALSPMSIQFLHNHLSFPTLCHWPTAALTPHASHSLPLGSIPSFYYFKIVLVFVALHSFIWILWEAYPTQKFTGIHSGASIYRIIQKNWFLQISINMANMISCPSFHTSLGMLTSKLLRRERKTNSLNHCYFGSLLYSVKSISQIIKWYLSPFI